MVQTARRSFAEQGVEESIRKRTGAGGRQPTSAASGISDADAMGAARIRPGMAVDRRRSATRSNRRVSGASSRVVRRNPAATRSCRRRGRKPRAPGRPLGRSRAARRTKTPARSTPSTPGLQSRSQGNMRMQEEQRGARWRDRRTARQSKTVSKRDRDVRSDEADGGEGETHLEVSSSGSPRSTSRVRFAFKEPLRGHRGAGDRARSRRRRNRTGAARAPCGSRAAPSSCSTLRAASRTHLKLGALESRRVGIGPTDLGPSRARPSCGADRAWSSGSCRRILGNDDCRSSTVAGRRVRARSPRGLGPRGGRTFVERTSSRGSSRELIGRILAPRYRPQRAHTVSWIA